MATIKVRKQADGNVRYTAIVRVREGKSIVHRESKTFAHRAAALSWARIREVALEDPKELQRLKALPQEKDKPTVSALIEWYIESFESVSKWQRSKQAHLKFLANHALGRIEATTLTAARLIQHIRERRNAGAPCR